MGGIVFIIYKLLAQYYGENPPPLMVVYVNNYDSILT